MREDTGIDHQQLTARAWLASEHDPTEAHLGIDRQDELRQLCFPDTFIQRRAQLGELGIFVLEQLAASDAAHHRHAVFRRPHGLSHRSHNGLGALCQRLEEHARIGR